MHTSKVNLQYLKEKDHLGNFYTANPLAPDIAFYLEINSRGWPIP
jgi:hypothetical protein